MYPLEDFTSKAGKEMKRQRIIFFDQSASGFSVTLYGGGRIVATADASSFADHERLVSLVENQSIILLQGVTINIWNDIPRGRCSKACYRANYIAATVSAACSRWILNWRRLAISTSSGHRFLNLLRWESQAEARVLRLSSCNSHTRSESRRGHGLLHGGIFASHAARARPNRGGLLCRVEFLTLVPLTSSGA